MSVLMDAWKIVSFFFLFYFQMTMSKRESEMTTIEKICGRHRWASSHWEAVTVEKGCGGRENSFKEREGQWKNVLLSKFYQKIKIWL